MTKIQLISLSRFRNLEHFQYMSDLDTLISKYTAGELGIDEFYPVFNSLLQNEGVAIRVEQGSAKSKLIEEYDQQRDNTFNGFNLSVKASLLSPFAEEVESSVIIRRVLDQYGDIRSLPYNEESGAMTNLITELQKPEYATHVEKIGRTAWITELDNLNKKFIATVDDRTTDYSGRESGDVRAIRKQVDPLYNQIVEQINATLVLKSAKRNVPVFVNELNEKIKYYKTAIAIRQGRSKEEKVASDT